MAQRMIIVFDNTMGLPGLEIDDGLALLYLLGRQKLMAAASIEPFAIEVLCTTHGNSNSDDTFAATNLLADQLHLEIPVMRGGAAGSYRPSASSTSPAAEALIAAVRSRSKDDEITLLSLGATTDLAIAEQTSPGTLAMFDRISFMGGITRPLYVGGNQMDELNFAVDHLASLATFSSVTGETTCIADAHNCLPLTFTAAEFLRKLAPEGNSSELAQFIRNSCIPWFERALRDWNTHGFVGWDVLAAVALVAPEMVRFQPYTFVLDTDELQYGRLTPPDPDQNDDTPLERKGDLANKSNEQVDSSNTNTTPTVTVNLTTIPDPEALKAHIYEAWQAALK